jgi:LmbE family N-acetylglucosaminyl deacetylase
MTDTTTTRVLAIFAHPDDPDFIAGGTLVRWADEGKQIALCIVTDGGAGSNLPDADLAALVQTRQAEQRAASAVQGLEDLYFLGYKDGTLQPTIELRRELTRLIRQLKPDIVMLMDPTAVYYGDNYINHPDHRAAGEAALYAVFPSAQTRPIFPELLAEGFEPHTVRELYIAGSMTPNMYVDISTTLERKIAALLHHQTQVGADIATEMRSWAAESGKAVGMAAAETFRVMRFG